MKKIFLIAAGTMLAVACTKDRTCTCTNTYTSTGGSTTQTSTFTIKDATKGQAKANCVSTTQSYTTGATETNDCKLD